MTINRRNHHTITVTTKEASVIGWMRKCMPANQKMLGNLAASMADDGLSKSTESTAGDRNSIAVERCDHEARTPQEQMPSNAAPWTEEEQQQIDAGIMDEDKFAERLYAQAKAAPPFIDLESVNEIERTLTTDAVRRLALITATKSGQELADIIADRESAISMAGFNHDLTDAAERYKSLGELLEAVRARLLILLCAREDMKEVYAEAKARAVQSDKDG